MVRNKLGMIAIPTLLVILVNIFLAIIAYHYYTHVQQILEISRTHYYIEYAINTIHTALTLKYLTKSNDTLTIPLKIPNNIIVIIDNNEVRYYPKLNVSLYDPANIITYAENGLVRYKFMIADGTLVMFKGNYILRLEGYPPIITVSKAAT